MQLIKLFLVIYKLTLRLENDKNDKNEQLKIVCEEINATKTEEIEKFIEKPVPQNKSVSYMFKYKNFICSPRSHFIFETIFYFLFLFAFSFLMLCEFKFEIRDDFIKTNETNNTQKAVHIMLKANISWVEYMVVFWVFSFFCRILFEV